VQNNIRTTVRDLTFSAFSTNYGQKYSLQTSVLGNLQISLKINSKMPYCRCTFILKFGVLCPVQADSILPRLSKRTEVTPLRGPFV
jgi:hypothetical protein